MYCLKCGNKLPDDASFCNNCGSKVQDVGNQNKANDNNRNYSSENLEDTLGKVVKRIDTASEKIAKKTNRNAHYKITDENVDNITKEIGPLTFSSNIDTSGIKRDKYTEHPYCRLGGFLAFLYYAGWVFTILGVVTLILAFFGIFMIFANMPNHIPILLVDIASAFVFIVLTFRFLFKIKNKEIDFLHFYIKMNLWFIIFYIVNVLVNFFTIFGPSLNSLQSFSALLYIPMLVQLIVTLIGILLSLFLICLYFCKSVRVRTYMGTDKYLKLSVFTKNVRPPKPAYEKNVDSNKSNMENNAYANNSSNSTNSNYSSNNNKNNDTNNMQEKNQSSPSPRTNSTSPETIFCANCGNKILSDNLFCTNCGSKIIKE